MKIKISADSTCDLSPELIERYHIGITPLYIIRGEETLRDGIDVHPQELYDYANATGKLCKTAAVNVSDYLAYFAACREEYDAVIHFTISSDMSGCYQNACIAAKEFTNVYPVDSRNLSTGIGHLVLNAAEMAEQGMDAADIAAALEKKREKLDVSFVIDTLEYLKRGGRCSPSAAFFGTMLKIKPVLHVDSEGRLIARSKVRGRMQALRAIAMKFGELEADKDQMIFISHGDCEKDAMVVKETLVKEFGCDPERIILSAVGPVIGSHSGPGTVALFFYGTEK